jgi:hypothetical protein
MDPNANAVLERRSSSLALRKEPRSRRITTPRCGHSFCSRERLCARTVAWTLHRAGFNYAVTYPESHTDGLHARTEVSGAADS